MELRCVADVAGPWMEPDFESSLITRCRQNWSTPIFEVSNYALATFIRQQFAWELTLPEARRRIAAGYLDNTELYDDELFVAVTEALLISFSRNSPNNLIQRTPEGAADRQRSAL
ncbi:hypothetical protein GJ700_31615 [Duganella sp. FT92W]|uniref:Uncharacterized protein n=1 Tax=Pseudoduganella rivuli TaxID=2666085 RepID=A0A7X2IUY4_9BURK|nr:hypothetical protein [Pseudoduganella rivuli]MRV76267.1 hypothetical protein [Pseudoduganella rivuli]